MTTQQHRWIESQFKLLQEQGFITRAKLLVKKLACQFGTMVVGFFKRRPMVWGKLVAASKKLGIYERLQFMADSKPAVLHPIAQINSYDQLNKSSRTIYAKLDQAIKQTARKSK